MLHKLSTLIVVLASICAVEVAAQDAALAPGTRVRVIQFTDQFSSPRERREATLIGTLQQIDSTSVTLLLNGRSLVVPRNLITRLDASRGNVSLGAGVLRGARRGALIGAGTGVLMTGISLAFVAEAGDGAERPPKGAVPLTVLMFSTLGGGVGAVVGVITRENWVPVWVDSRQVSISVGPDPSGGARAGFSLRF